MKISTDQIELLLKYNDFLCKHRWNIKELTEADKEVLIIDFDKSLALGKLEPLAKNKRPGT